MRNSGRKFQEGITLVELAIAIAIVGILAGFASRSVAAAMHAARSSSGTASLFAALTTARSAAANAGVDVVLCPSPDGESCAAGDHWESGWIAFAATHAGNERDSDEPIVLRQPSLPTRVHLVTTKGRTRIRFQASGGNAGSNATFTFCDGRGARSATAYAMSNSGNLHATPTEADNVAEACAGL